jgi:hypothetical protein
MMSFVSCHVKTPVVQSIVSDRTEDRIPVYVLDNLHSTYLLLVLRLFTTSLDTIPTSLFCLLTSQYNFGLYF